MNLFQITSYCWLILMFYWFFAGMHTKITVKKEGKTNRLFYLVLLSAAFAMVYCSALKIGFLGVRFFSENIYISWGGVIITATGVSFAIAARISLGENWSGRVTVKKGHELIQSGPYSITRHPIYTGMFFGLMGAVIVQGEIRGPIALILLFTALEMKISKEEKFMKESFPAYQPYSQKTKKLIPLIY